MQSDGKGCLGGWGQAGARRGVGGGGCRVGKVDGELWGAGRLLRLGEGS